MHDDEYLDIVKCNVIDVFIAYILVELYFPKPMKYCNCSK